VPLSNSTTLLPKRLYGSSEADVIFFDMAIDKLNAGDSGRRGTPLPGNKTTASERWRMAKTENYCSSGT
jgi:hypothetical protein